MHFKTETQSKLIIMNIFKLSLLFENFNFEKKFYLKFTN